ncbi:MAG: M12 family metallo-peptidase, partial [Prevotellaceae bacterium]|nr:M12 family metallo-peptidase [Prevotellaceae bacterium]
MKKFYLAFLMFTCIAVSVLAQRTINLNVGKPDFTKQVTIPQQYLKEAKTARVFAVNPALQHAESVKVGDIVTLQLFENDNYTAHISHIVTDVNGNFTLLLKLPDYPMAYAMITTNREGKSLFTLNLTETGQIFASRSSINSDIGYLIEIDENIILKSVSDGLSVPQQTAISIDQNTKGRAVDVRQNLAPQAAPDALLLNCLTSVTSPTAPAAIDVLMVYTPNAAAWAASYEGGITNTIASAMAQTAAVITNQDNSDAVNLVHSEQITYTEHSYDMGTDLDNLTGTADGYMDNVHQLRKQYDADIVVLITNANDNGGLGWVLSNDVDGSYQYAFNVVRVQQISFTTTSIHEIGHNMGMQHNSENSSTPNPLYPYAYGWHWTGNNGTPYGSVMSYIGNETPYFSNPNKVHQGQPTGTATANNAQTFRNTKHVVAFYSDKLNNLPDAPTNIVVSNQTNNGATFSWDAATNAVSYRVGFPDYWYYYSNITNTSFTLNDANDFQPCNTYQFYIAAVNECGDVVSSQTLTFNTICNTVAPTVTTLAATDITMNSATLNKTVVANGASILTEGFKYKKTSESVWETSANGNLTALDFATEYQFYAYATTATNTFSGNILTFITAACNDACTYTFVANDTFGDGWNGGSVVLKQGGNVVATLTAIDHNLSSTPTTDEIPVMLCPDLETEVSFNTGEFPLEISFALLDINGLSVAYKTPLQHNDVNTNVVINTFTSSCQVVAACQYTFILEDNYGDGWNGAWLVIKQNGNETHHLKATNFGLSNEHTTETFTANIPNGVLTELWWEVPEDNYFPSEISFTVKDYNDNIIYQHGNPSDLSTIAPILTFTPTCLSTPPVVVTNAATSITQTTATLNKTVTAGSETIDAEGFYYKKSVESGSEWILSPDGALSDLAVNTQYDFFAYAATALFPLTSGDTLYFTTECLTYN